MSKQSQEAVFEAFSVKLQKANPEVSLEECREWFQVASEVLAVDFGTVDELVAYAVVHVHLRLRPTLRSARDFESTLWWRRVLYEHDD